MKQAGRLRYILKLKGDAGTDGDGVIAGAVLSIDVEDEFEAVAEGGG